MKREGSDDPIDEVVLIGCITVGAVGAFSLGLSVAVGATVGGGIGAAVLFAEHRWRHGAR